MKLQRLWIFFLTVFVCTLSTPVFSQEEQNLDKALQTELGKTNGSSNASGAFAEDSKDEPSAAWLLLKVLLLFGVLFGSLYFVLRFIQKSREYKYPIKGVMEVLSSLTLAQGREIQIVDVNGKVYVLGVSEHSVSLISEINDPMEKKLLLEQKSNGPVEFRKSVSFVEELFGVLKKKMSPSLGSVHILEDDYDLDRKKKEALERIQKWKKGLGEST